ncbi:MAG: hypothetical protein UW75_C0011G0015 [Parcubacteria group bacterium GW2011_GWF2_44_8]|nr:MAG: hypothetical protein UW75_C0011G0015 [Parcubacteria group bacterium GW2011_GWF2_44_8]
MVQPLQERRCIMVGFVLEHKASCYVRPQRRRSTWRLQAKGADQSFEFPPWMEIKLLWKQIAPEEAELKYYVSDRKQLIFTVPVRTFTRERKKRFLAGINELCNRERECV